MGDAASLDADNNSRLPLRNTHTSIRNTQIDNLEEDDVPRNVEGIVNEAADDHEDDGSIVRNRRARGLNRPNWATESIEVVEFNARGQAIGPKKTVARWQRFLGLMAVDQGLFPIDVKDWRRFEHGTTLGDAWKRIKRTIDWSDPETRKKAPKIRAVAEQKLNHLWKKHKANLKKNWYDPFLNSEERWNCTDDRVSKEQWRLLVQYWESGPALKRSITNKCNRAKRRMHHTTGTKSYAQVRNQYKVNHRGVSPDRCKMFELCHLRKNGTPVNETAAKAMEDMNSKLIDIRDKKMQNQLPDEVTAEEINIVYAEVLGREKDNRVRGYGIGVRTEDMLGVLREKRGLRLEFDDMRESYKERIVQVTKDANEREERIKREMREEGRATTEKVKRLEQLLTKQQAIMENVLANASNVSSIDSELLLGHVSSSTLQVGLGSNRLEEIMTATLNSPYMPSQTLIDQDGYRPILRGIEEEEHARNVGPVFKV